MKKKLALLLVAAMTVTAIPATSFAGTTNRVSKVVTAQVDDHISTSITFEDKGDTTEYEQITATLTNAEWDYDKLPTIDSAEGATSDAVKKAEKALEDLKKEIAQAEEIAAGGTVTEAIAKAKSALEDANVILTAKNAAKAAADEAVTEAKAELDKVKAEYTTKLAAVLEVEGVDAANIAAAKAGTYTTDSGNVGDAQLVELNTAATNVKTEEGKVKTAEGTVKTAEEAVKTAEEKVADAQKAYDAVKDLDAEKVQNLIDKKDELIEAAEKKVEDAKKAEANGDLADGIYFTKITDKEALVTMVGQANKGGADEDIELPIKAEITDEGDVQLTIDPMSSNISGGTYTVAIGADGGSKTTIEKSTDISDSSTQIKPIVITETTAGSFKAGEIIKLKLGGNFTYTESKTPKVTTPSGDGEVSFVKFDEDTIEIKVDSKSTVATKIVVDNLWIEEDDAEVGNEAEITVSGAGTSKTTLTVGKYVDYGFSFKAEDEEVPVLYSGRENGDTDVLKVTFKETAPKSWFTGRKATITLPEGVKFTSVEVSDKDNLKTEGTVTIDSKDRSIANIEGFEVVDGKKGEVEIEMEIEVSPKFTGDVVATLSGPAISNEELTAVVAKVESPVKVEAKRTDVSIDYRNVEVADITITEAYAGALEKGTTLNLQAEKMEFEGGWDWEVTEGDIKIDDVTKSGGTLSIKVKSESSKTPGTIKISGLKVYLDRTLPVGDYKLKLVAVDAKNDVADGYNEDDAFFQTHMDDAKDKTIGFDCDSVTAVEDYIRVVTAGRDQDDSTFTTKITVTVGESTLTAGDKVVELDVPAFINADSRAMLPVRAVIEALSGTVAIKWDDATKTAFFSMGSRVFSMTVGQKTMSINGTNVAMTTAPVIVNERIFIPLRDLGVALGLNDDKIVWDDATKTATLNGTAADKTTDK